LSKNLSFREAHAINSFLFTEAFNQLRVRTALERTAEDDASPSISGAGHPPSPKKRKAAGSLQEESSMQARSGNDQQDTSKAVAPGTEEELLQVFEQIELNKDFYDAIARTESCAGEAPQKNTRADAEIAAFQAAVDAAKTVLREQVKELEEKGQEASPAFFQAYASNVMALFASEAAESSYSGEDLGDDYEGYFTSSSVGRPNSSSLQGPSQPPASKKRPTSQQSGGGGGVGNGSGGAIDKEITVLERTASVMVLHSPTTRSNATPTTTQNNNRTPTASGILSGNGNSSFIDPELSDTAGMVEVDNDRVLPGAGREGINGLVERQQQREQQQRQQQRERINGNAQQGGEEVLLPPQTPGEPIRPENDADEGNHEEEQGRQLGLEEEEEHAALVREMSILEAVDVDYDAELVDQLEEEVVIEEEIEEQSSPSRDENENQFFSAIAAPTAAAVAAGAGGGGNGNGLFNQTNGVAGGMVGIPHQDHSPLPTALIGQQQASPIAVPQRPQAAAGHREKRDPRPSSSGGPSRLSNDPPKRQRKGPGFIVGSAPQDGGGFVVGGTAGELFPRAQQQQQQLLPTAAAAGGGVGATLPAAAAGPMRASSQLPQAPLDNDDHDDCPAVSLGSVGGGGGEGVNKKSASSGKLYRKTAGDEAEEDEIDGGGKKKKKKAGENERCNNPVLGIGVGGGGATAARARGKKRDAPVVVREGASFSISLETVPAAELGGRGAWGSSLVCADLTVHDVASQYWPSIFLKKAAAAAAAARGDGGGGGGERVAGTGAKTTTNGGGGGLESGMSGVVRELSSAEKEKVQELTAALEAAMVNAVSEEGPIFIGGRRLNANMKSLAASTAFEEFWKEREQRLIVEMQEEKHGVAVEKLPPQK
jgi:hypothetical protein